MARSGSLLDQGTRGSGKEEDFKKPFIFENSLELHKH